MLNCVAAQALLFDVCAVRVPVEAGRLGRGILVLWFWRLVLEQFESLILAQDERWRQA